MNRCVVAWSLVMVGPLAIPVHVGAHSEQDSVTATYRFRGDALVGMPLMTSSWLVTFYSAAAGRALLLLGSSRARDSRGFLDQFSTPQ